MAKHERFNYENIESLNEDISRLGADISLSDDFSPLKREISLGSLKTPNAMAILPMEGCDSNSDGSPSELVIRRYMRFAEGGAGLIWWEACAVIPEGRANPLQMMLTKDNASEFEKLLKETNAAAIKAHGYKPVNILQLTHSGRYCRPEGHKPAPIIPQRDPILDARSGVTEETGLVSDDYLDNLIGYYIASAKLAEEIGFDGIDIKACHRYLISELLASHTREGKYGGSFENRSRFLLDVVKAVHEACNFIIACRFNCFDAHPYPYGFGEGKNGLWDIDLEEPLELTRRLCQNGVSLLSNTAGNPYYIYPQVTRPFDYSSEGIPVPDEHPLESTARLFSFTREIQKAAGNIPVVGNGYTWLRQYFPYAGAYNIQNGHTGFVGIGRLAFAYPGAPGDLLEKGVLDPKKCCISCSKCTQIMRDHGRTGCVIRDAGVYGPLFKQYREEAIERNK